MHWDWSCTSDVQSCEREKNTCVALHFKTCGNLLEQQREALRTSWLMLALWATSTGSPFWVKRRHAWISSLGSLDIICELRPGQDGMYLELKLSQNGVWCELQHRSSLLASPSKVKDSNHPLRVTYNNSRIHSISSLRNTHTHTYINKRTYTHHICKHTYVYVYIHGYTYI